MYMIFADAAIKPGDNTPTLAKKICRSLAHEQHRITNEIV